MLLGLAGCSTEPGRGQWARVGMVEPASDRAPYMGDLWIGAWIACAVIGVLVWGLIFYSMVKFRRSEKNMVPHQTRYHVPLEVLYTIVPFLIIIVLFFYTVKAENRVLAKTEPAHTINVVGQKWSWTFNYMEKDNQQIGAIAHESGTIEKIPDVYVPVNKPIRFNLTSADVIHSFWVPAWYFKLDAIPGHPNSFDITPTKLGKFDGKCAELCGTYHAAMLFTVHVVTEEEYNAYVKGLVDKGQTGELTGPSAASALPSAPAKEEEK
ncbi:aa3-type cytochrome oxidase subunit II [Luteococcus sp. H101]|uniref:aa3-type cytochrome oxidase subunit II n=1 Tax=unclassified Luteococcus TaxID=2639923 RepID=UPI00406C17FB